MTALHFDERTPQAVQHALAAVHNTGQRVRIWYGDTETGAAWPEEHDVTGTVGNSTGRLKVPLLVHNRRSMGGAPILDACIVRIDTTAGRTLYRHPKFDPGAWSYTYSAPGGTPGRPWVAFRNGSVHARFAEKKQAANYCAFMVGERYRT